MNNPGLTEDQRDCLQEIVNVAMGRAGDSLARFLETFIHLSVPKIKLVDSAELTTSLVVMVGEVEKVSAVRQGFYSTVGDTELRGEAIIIFSDQSFLELADLLAYEEALNDTTENELLLDISNILTGACLNGLAEQMEGELGYSAPSIIGKHIATENVVAPGQIPWHQALLIEINYTLENSSFSCSLLLLMPGSSIDAVKLKLDHLLDEF